MTSIAARYFARIGLATALLLASAAPAAIAATTSATKQLQTLLAAVGYDPGPADGMMGPKTRQAVSAFNGAVGLGNGATERETLDVLKRLSGN